MILKFKQWYPRIKKSAWVAPSADVIGDVKIGKETFTIEEKNDNDDVLIKAITFSFRRYY